MREAYRVDLRHGPRMVRSDALRKNKKPAESDANDGAPHQNNNNNNNNQHAHASFPFPGHPGIMAALQRLMSPPCSNPDAVHGNFGRWNFNGGGPGNPIKLKVGKLGAVVSLPGCADQAIHADTYHLYEHAHLPPHYVNLFLPTAASGGEGISQTVGQTAFVIGSHRMDICAGLVEGVTSPNITERDSRMVRPHLSAGDAILFDCRVLHFGLANKSLDIWRPLLYSNITMPWFEDKKNWDMEYLFQ
mmetsp:Transcript_23666/g.32359  ORF Transcript_23666/g.32359 Transcript_23666/m.32359 type:complete len:246 (-) Transcript_23666:118-855(-)